ncbi:uncharacterized protein TrAFT101_002844 [Trichoderma asperellum]|uniref:uncharacterized protein n=1 Tax=Trichoderma asperellum TaxID=101201 RepID=UPI00331EB732|nr:hypothetical protein TrAFT101_002844 [Trichoderma asperellum]
MPIAKRRACVTCTNAKCKCSPQSDNLCQRCARLGKQCVYLDLPERKKRRRNDDDDEGGSNSRVVALENRVEELVAQLDAIRNGGTQHVPTSSSTDDTSPPSTGALSIPDALRSSGPASQKPELLDAVSEGYHGREPPKTSVLEGLPDIVDRGFLSVSEAENLVSQFKSRFVWMFPFVVLDPSQTVVDLRKKEPLLFLAVVAASIPSAHPIRKLLADEIMQHITSRIVASSERNLGLVRALLVLCAWYRYPAQKGHVQLMLLMNLCTTMVYDLGLNRLKGELTTDQQRALLGTYWVTASLPRGLNRPEAMANSKKIEECCNNMAVSTEYPSDRCIRPFILAQSFVNTIDSSYSELGESGHDETLVRIMVGAKLRQFESLEATLKEELSRLPNPTTSVFTCNMHYVNIAIRDMALDDEYVSYQTRHAFDQSPSAEAFKTSAYRSSLLWHLLRHSKALIQAYMDIPDAQLSQVTVFTLSQICASLVILPRSVSALLKLIVARQGPPHSRTWPVQGEALDEARAIVDEADFLSTTIRLYEKFRTLIVGLTTQEKGLDVAGTLCCHMSVLASWYAPRVQAILGVDLVVKHPLASITPHAGDIVDVINAANASNSGNTSTASVPPVVYHSTERTGSTDVQQGFPGAYTGAEDGNYLFSDELWASVLESFTSFA